MHIQSSCNATINKSQHDVISLSNIKMHNPSIHGSYQSINQRPMPYFARFAISMERRVAILLLLLLIVMPSSTTAKKFKKKNAFAGN